MSEPITEYSQLLQGAPESWITVKMQYVGRIVSGGTPSRDAPSLWNGGIPWVTPGELTSLSTKIISKTNESISPAGLAGSGANLLPEGSLLITSRATLGARAVNAVPMTTNQGFKSLVPHNRDLTGYLYHLVEKIKPEMVRRASGTTFLEISGSEFGDIDLSIPSTDLAIKIAEILDTLDVAIRGAEAVVAKLKAMKLGLLHDLLTRGIDANGDLRPPQSEAPYLYKQTPLGWLPEEWDAAKLPQLATANRPVLRTGPFGSSLKGEHWRETGRPVITIGSFGENGFLKDELLFIDEKKAITMIEYEVFEGDLVFSRVADVGRSLVVAPEQVGWIMSSNLMRISVDSKKLSPELLHAQLRNSVSLRKRMSQLVNSAGRDVANSAVMLALDFAVPQPHEQEEIIKIIEANDETLKCEEEQLEKLRLQKSGLMDDLLTGRVPVTPLL